MTPMTPIQFACTGCQTKLKVSNTAMAGKKMKCPKCGAIVTVPQREAPPEEEIIEAAVVASPSPSPREESIPEVTPVRRPSAEAEPPRRPRHRDDDYENEVRAGAPRRQYDDELRSGPPRRRDNDAYDDRGPPPRPAMRPPAKRGPTVPIISGVVCFLYIAALVAVWFGLLDGLLLGDTSVRDPMQIPKDMPPRDKLPKDRPNIKDRIKAQAAIVPAQREIAIVAGASRASLAQTFLSVSPQASPVFALCIKNSRNADSAENAETC